MNDVSNLELLQHICADMDGADFNLAMIELLQAEAEEAVAPQDDEDLKAG